MNVAQRVVRGLEEAKKKLFPPEVRRDLYDRRRPLDVEEEFKCPHGIVFARRYVSGAYSGKPAADCCAACWLEVKA